MTKDFFNGLWNVFDKEDFYKWYNLIEQRWKMAKVNTKDKICLDAGCGHGVASLLMAKKARSVYAIDIESGEFARKLFKNKNNIYFRQCSVLDLPLPDDVFDVVNCTGVIVNTPNPLQGLSELKRVTAPGGVLILGVYGKGGVRNKLISISNFICRNLIPQKVMEKTLSVFFSSFKVSMLLDRLYVKYEARFSEKEIKMQLSGFENYRRINVFNPTFFSKIWLGEGWIYITATKQKKEVLPDKIRIQQLEKQVDEIKGDLNDYVNILESSNSILTILLFIEIIIILIVTAKDFWWWVF